MGKAKEMAVSFAAIEVKKVQDAVAVLIRRMWLYGTEVYLYNRLQLKVKTVMPAVVVCEHIVVS